MPNKISAETCELFNIPFFQFAQMKKYCPETIPTTKADYKREWNHWKETILQVSQRLAFPFAPPHIEKWCNGWQVRAHFFAYFKYQQYSNSAAIFSVLLNRRRLSVSLDWHCYRADRSQITLAQYNQWRENSDMSHYADFDLWRGDESEYADYSSVASLMKQGELFNAEQDFYCIGKNLEKQALAEHNLVEFIAKTIQSLQPLYERCHR
ncbi:Glucose-6-phosphate 1-dehydrogenase [[Pasteurella] aerogenes]|nr:Glucose-6-phosphate 1-dehydrogenase [[Pasteurella] aerogenes]